MNGSRLLRPSWIVGVVLLIASLVGASRVYYAPGSPDSTGRDSTAGDRRGGVVCTGYVDVENGQQLLAPAMAGEVAEVSVHESQGVVKDQVLLKLDDRLAQDDLAQAEIGLRLAKAQVEEAELAVKLHGFLVNEQKSAVDAKKAQLSAARTRLERERLIQGNDAAEGSKLAIQAVEEEIKALDAAVRAEQTKLERIQAARPDVLVKKAQIGVENAEKVVSKAKLALEKYVLTAPADGVVLRINVARGSVLGPQTARPPVQFRESGPLLVRAEVEQEFANRVTRGQAAAVFDDTNAAVRVRGRVERLADGYLPKRGTGPTLDPLAANEARVLEVVIALDPEQAKALRFGQKVRVHIGTE